MIPSNMPVVYKKQLVESNELSVIVGNLYKLGVYGISIRCVLEHERPMIRDRSNDDIAGREIAQKILCTRLWWPTLHKDAKEYYQSCDVCQRVGKPSRIDEMPLNP
jgi:hypothetical protein